MTPKPADDDGVLCQDEEASFFVQQIAQVPADPEEIPANETQVLYVRLMLRNSFKLK